MLEAQSVSSVGKAVYRLRLMARPVRPCKRHETREINGAGEKTGEVVSKSSALSLSPAQMPLSDGNRRKLVRLSVDPALQRSPYELSCRVPLHPVVKYLEQPQKELYPFLSTIGAPHLGQDGGI